MPHSKPHPVAPANLAPCITANPREKLNTALWNLRLLVVTLNVWRSLYLLVWVSDYVGSKYCPLLESEGGLSLLEPISQNNKARFRQVQQLAQQVLRRCSQFRLSADSQSTDDLDQLSAASAADVNNVDMTDDSDNDVMDDDSDNDSALDYWPSLLAERPSLLAEWPSLLWQWHSLLAEWHSFCCFTHCIHYISCKFLY